MAGVRIVTDSACDLDPAQAKAYGIEIVPLTIRFGSEEFVDRSELTVEEFYRRMHESPTLPETAAPSPGAFGQAFRKLADEGADSIVCINISSALSATMQSAQAGARELISDLDVHVLDSRSVAAGLGNIVLEAAYSAARGMAVGEIVALVEQLVDRTRVFGTLDTLDNLKKGGRIGSAQALLGSMLSIKPLVDLSSGVVEEAAKPRTRKKALALLAEYVIDEPKVEHLCVMHGMAPDVDEFLALLAPKYTPDEIRISTVGPVVGTHAGPRVMGVAFLLPAEERRDPNVGGRPYVPPAAPDA